MDDRLKSVIGRIDHQPRLTAARNAVVEAAKEWEPYYSRINDRQALANAKMRLSAAVAHLLEVEKENG